LAGRSKGAIIGGVIAAVIVAIFVSYAVGLGNPSDQIKNTPTVQNTPSSSPSTIANIDTGKHVVLQLNESVGLKSR